MSKSEKYAVGVDLGGTSVKVGIVTEKGKIVKKTSIDTKASGGPKVVVAQIEKAVAQLLEKNKKKIQGIGIGAPGTISTKKGTVQNPPNLPGWEKVNLGKIIEKKFGNDVYVENDANAAAIGEMIFGAGKKLESFLMITLGTGVGGGIIFNKKLFRGQTGGAGELGHMTIDLNGPKCNCGSFGCIETYVGNNYLVERVKKQLKENKSSLILKLVDNDLSKLTPKIINDALVQDDKFAQSVIVDLGKYLGAALASACNLLDISTFIIGGGVAGFGAPLFNEIEKTTKSRVLTPLRKRVKIIPAKLKNDAGIKGASALVFHNS